MSSAPIQRPAPGPPLLWHGAGGLLARLLVGGILLYAGLHKVGHAADFARLVYGYRLLHTEVLNLVAIAMPWVEVVTGALLVLGLLRRSSGLVACGMFATFVVAIGLAMARGIDAPCGCFSVASESDRIGWFTLVRAGLLALLSAYLVVHPLRFAELDAVWERGSGGGAVPPPAGERAQGGPAAGSQPPPPP